MNRRKFLSWLGTGLTVGAAASVLPLESLLKYSGNKTYFDMGRNIPVNPLIGQWVSYKFHYTVTLPPDTNFRIRMIEAV